MQTAEKTQVVVAGAGPVGTVMALSLARRGYQVVLCEKHPHRAQDLRASTFHPPTLEILDDLGVVTPIMDYGLKAPIYHYRERQTGETIAFDFAELAEDTRFPFRIQCEQHVMAGMVAAELESLPNVQVLYNHAVVAFEQSDNGVAVHVESPIAIRHFNADYLVAADGGNSIIRKWLDVEFEGFTYPEKFLCLSTKRELREDFAGLAPVNYVSDAQEWLVLLRAPSAWRVLLPVRDEVPDQELLTDTFKERVFADLVGDSSVETVHRTVYRVHQRVAENFNFGRAFLVGDAAHLNNPLGGFGMNSGIHDAWNLHEKIGDALDNGHDAALFEKFDRQRRAVTHSFIQAQTIQTKRFLEYSDGERHAERLNEMRDTAADDVKRREFILRQSMIQSVRDAEAID